MLAVIVIVVGTVWALQGCGGPTVAQQTAVAKDAIDQKTCIDNAGGGVGRAALKAEIDKCRDKVKAERDSGAE